MFNDSNHIIRVMITGGILTLLGVGCGAKSESPQAQSTARSTSDSTNHSSSARTRLPAVAGLFYPKEEKALAKMLDGMLDAAPARSIPDLRGLICPHAGYVYSGPIASHSYKLLAGRQVRTVIILAASHYADFQGVSVPDADAYETPLGKVPVSPKVRLLARQSPFVVEPRCFVQRPQWSGIASKPAPDIGEDTPETWEHSVEVQVPFLQRALKDFSILPVVFGDADPAKVAAGLAEILDDQTLVVASTDLSHYRPYDEAKAMDQQTVKWICELNFGALQTRKAVECACGRLPVLTLMHLAKLKGWSPQLLDYRNSGDTAGDKSRVVGYAAIAFSGTGTVKAESKTSGERAPGQFTEAERKRLLALARKTLEQVTSGRGLPEVNPDTLSAPLKEPKGCFVTLTKNGQLRGCIGNIQPSGPLYEAVTQNAQAAALRDHRFSPVTADEVDQLHIEISVLTAPAPLKFGTPEELLQKLQPHQDGVVLKIGARGATFLPQVWEQLPDKTEFLNHLAQKSGAAPGDWRGKDVAVSIYHVEAFEEPKK